MKKLPRVKKDIGYYLRVFRATYNLSQADASRLMGFGPSYWCLLESGRRRFDARKAFEVASVIGCPVEILIGVPVPKQDTQKKRVVA